MVEEVINIYHFNSKISALRKKTRDTNSKLNRLLQEEVAGKV